MKHTNKILLYALIAMFLVGALLLYDYYRNLKKQFEQAFNSRSVEIVTDVSPILRNYVVTGNIASAYNYVEQIAEARHIKYFKIEVSGIPTDFGREISQSFQPPEEANFAMINGAMLDYNDIKQRICYFKQPIYFDENDQHKAAELIIGFSYGELHRQLNSLRLKSIVLLLITGLVLFLTFKIAKRSYSRIYDALLNYFADLSQGKDVELPKQVADFEEILTQTRKMATELTNYQKELEKSAHLASIGQSTAMVAHDVRKPLASMKALLTALPDVKDDPAQMEKMIASVDRNIAHTNAMLNEIMDFSRDATALEIAHHDPQSIITSALSDVLRNHAVANVKISYELGHLHTLKVDGTRIVRVLTNLLDNALDAMKADDEKIIGDLLIRTVEDSGKTIISISIIDRGNGIPEEILSKIFDPFFTKGKKGGTGLGLAICQRVVNMHGGKIEARNRKDGKLGAEFAVELPAGDRRVLITESELIHSSTELTAFREEEKGRIDYGDTLNTADFMKIHKGRGRPSYLLLVDDEPLFRETVRSLLNGTQVKDHVKVVEVAAAETAFKLFEARHFDYVIADIDLGRGRMNGYEMTEDLLHKYPDTYVLIHSNKRREEMDRNVREIASSKFMGFLPKPMRQSELLQFLACKTFEVPLSRQKQVPMRKVLVVNDDDALLVMYKILLKSPETQVLAASDVEGAVEHLTKHKIDVILSDINLGDNEPSGYDLLKHVREKDAGLPFYLISGYSRADEEPKARALGANGYLQLPVDEAQLRELLQ